MLAGNLRCGMLANNSLGQYARTDRTVAVDSGLSND